MWQTFGVSFYLFIFCKRRWCQSNYFSLLLFFEYRVIHCSEKKIGLRREPDGSGQFLCERQQSPLTNLHAQPTGVSVCYWVSFFFCLCCRKLHLFNRHRGPVVPFFFPHLPFEFPGNATPVIYTYAGMAWYNKRSAMIQSSNVTTTYYITGIYDRCYGLTTPVFPRFSGLPFHFMGRWRRRWKLMEISATIWLLRVP